MNFADIENLLAPTRDVDDLWRQLELLARQDFPTRNFLALQNHEYSRERIAIALAIYQAMRAQELLAKVGERPSFRAQPGSKS